MLQVKQNDLNPDHEFHKPTNYFCKNLLFCHCLDLSYEEGGGVSYYVHAQNLSTKTTWDDMDAREFFSGSERITELLAWEINGIIAMGG